MPKTLTKDAVVRTGLPPRRRGPEPLVSLSTTPEWLTIPEAAALIRSSRKTVLRIIDAGRLHAFEISERKRLVRVDELKTLIRPRRRQLVPRMPHR